MLISNRPVLKLLAWLIPTQLMAMALQIATTTYASRYLFFAHLESRIPEADMSHALHIYTNIRLISSMAYLLGHVVIAVWLGTRRHGTRASRWVWSLSGLLTGYWGLALYFLLATRTSAVEAGASSE